MFLAIKNVKYWVWIECMSMCIAINWPLGLYIHIACTWFPPSFSLWFDLSSRHLSCLRSWPIMTESGCWLSCEGERRASLFLLWLRSWKSLMTLTKSQKSRGLRWRSWRAHLQMLWKVLLRWRSALHLRPAAAAVAALQPRHLQPAKARISE